MPEPQEFTIDGARGLVDLSWAQWAPQIQQDDIDRDPRFNQYPYQEGDDYEEDEEEMEVDDQVPGNADGTRMAPPTGTQHLYNRPEATYTPRPDQTLGSPRSIHTNMDAAMEMGGPEYELRQARHPQGDLCGVKPFRNQRKPCLPQTWSAVSQRGWPLQPQISYNNLPTPHRWIVLGMPPFGNAFINEGP